MTRRARRRKGYKLPPNKNNTSDRLHERLRESIGHIASWDSSKHLERKTKLRLSCLKHKRDVWKATTVGCLLSKKNRILCPNCKDCIRENIDNARSKRSPTLKTIRNDCYWRFNEDDDWANMPTHFYIVNISRMFNKFGIAKSLSARALSAKYQGLPYREKLFCSDQYPRSWVWTAEQIIKHATTDYAPKGASVNGVRLDQWMGSSELRHKKLDVQRIEQWFRGIINLIQERGSWRSVFWSSMNQTWTMEKLDDISSQIHSSAVLLAC